MSQVRTQQSTTTRALPEIRWSPGGIDRVPGRIVAAAFLSVLLPGLGHILIGRRRKGWMLIGITVAFAVLAVALIPREPFAALAMFTRPRTLGGLLIADIALMLFRVYAVIDVVRGSRQGEARLTRSPGLMAMLVLLLAIIAAPHVAVGYYDIVTYRFLDTMFNSDSPRKQTAAPTEVQLTREIRLKDGVNPVAPPVVAGED